jgi:hypothetical protein
MRKRVLQQALLLGAAGELLACRGELHALEPCWRRCWWPSRKEVGMVRMRGAEDTDHACQCGFGAQAHVQRLHGHPDCVDADQPVTSRSQAALRLSMGTLARTVVPLRWISTSMRAAAGSGEAAGREGGACIGN